MKRPPLRRALPVLLTLSLFLAWTVAGVVHHHADQPGCELCKAMHNGMADLAPPSEAPAPRLAHELIAVPSVSSLTERPLPHTRERAPPSA